MINTNTSPTQINYPGKVRERFVTFIRTKQFLKQRLHGVENPEAIHINQKEIIERFFASTNFDLKNEIQILINSGEIEVSAGKLLNGYTMHLYRALKPGHIDLTLLKPKQLALDPITSQMKANLKYVSLSCDAPFTDYFAFFLKHKFNYLDYFFLVDDFSGRVHTPISSFHKEFRPNILLDNSVTGSIDIATMQPLLLGKILQNTLGPNQYSEWIDQGKDIYIMIKKAAGLETRDLAKKRFFEILFGKPNKKLELLLGNGKWITWINHYKSTPEPRNPKGEKIYNNLAWLLQTYEVQIMRKIWGQLVASNIMFLSIHDEIICKQSDLSHVKKIMHQVLTIEFKYFRLKLTPETLPMDLMQVVQHKVQYIPVSPLPDIKHDYIAEDGILYIHWPGLP